MSLSSWSCRWIAVAAMCLATWLSLGGTAAAQPALNLQLAASGFSIPVGIANARDGSNRLFIVELGGVIKIYNGSQVLATPFLDITSKVLTGGERGLLGLAFDANYVSNGFFYVYYTSQPDGEVTIARYSVTADPNVANPNSEFILKTQAHSDFSNHNGGSLLFGPDGCLYAGIGDGGSGGDPNNNGQNLATLLGKIIRISPIDGGACAAAPGNPFVGMAGVRDEIWALGLRNPWRITFDRQTGDLLIADVGQSTREEVDFQPAGIAGRNYCWRAKEGTLVFDAGTTCSAGTPTDPVFEYDHSAGKCSITGGYRYRGSRIPEIVGTYFYGDYCTGQIWGATESGGIWMSNQFFDTTFNISSFGEDESGEIYVVDISGGAFYRLVGTRTTTTTGQDFDGDGKADILLRHSSGYLAMWLMNSNTISSNLGVGGLDPSWTIVGIGDFNGDGKSDILLRHTSGYLAMWLMDSNTISSNLGVGGLDPAWQVGGTGDFNSDLKSDILLRHSSGYLAMWLMNSNTISSNLGVGGLDTSWQLVSTGDYNGDGKSDILLRHSSGFVAMWLMNGNAISSNLGVGGVDTSWQIQ